MGLVLIYVVQITEHEKQWHTHGETCQKPRWVPVWDRYCWEKTSCIFVCLIKEFSVIYSDLFKDVCRENNIEDIVFSPRAKIKHILTLKYNDDKISHWSKGQACLLLITKDLGSLNEGLLSNNMGHYGYPRIRKLHYYKGRYSAYCY